MAGGVKIVANVAYLEKGIADIMRKDPKICRAAMREASHLMKREAVKRAPIDEGHLSGAILGGTFENENGVFGAEVKVPSNTPAAAYAIPMHDGEYNLGANSLAKQAKVGVVVGPGYFSRMLTECRERILNAIAKKVINLRLHS